MSKRRIVITGLGAVTPLGCSVDLFWKGIIEGKNGIGPITSFDCSAFTTRFAGECRDFDPLKWIEAKNLTRLDRFAQFALAALPGSGQGLQRTSFTHTYGSHNAPAPKESRHAIYDCAHDGKEHYLCNELSH